ncbi:C25 family cysteine peptidase [Dyadobacter sp. LJ53]|uniref:putative type IX secretion system sortase PorU2 n=1 Tax=Dyadobacter chenwenxiniae TaxID=2906456 RepID=UPI001F463728|nr:C25 family cysteine peptidase [Dyadobacter chenwenxiniae]MCF0052937.1 C25 family cysteine peptidase [Dyadobacter chenwenxiniae]
MRARIFTKTIFLLVLVYSFTTIDLKVHAQWSGTYGNDWLAGKYSQPWVKINVGVVSGALTKGVYRVAMTSAKLPAEIKNADKAKLQLWHRGRQVNILKADNNELLFYAVPNDGKSDELLFRPTSSRANPYYSMYSDESSYFLTVGAANGDRAPEETLTDASSVTLTQHIRTESKNYQLANEYSHATTIPLRPIDQNSFFEDGKTRTGSRLFDNASHPIHTKDATKDFDFTLKARSGTDKPKVEVLINGRTFFPSNPGDSRNIHVYVGKDAANLREVGMVYIAGFTFGKFSFDLENTDLDANGKGLLGFKTDASPENIQGNTIYDVISLTYYNVTYNQQIDMLGAASAEFRFAATSQGAKNKIVIAGAPAGTLKFYDITDIDKPRIINGTAASLVFTRPNANELVLLATNQAPATVADAKINQVNFTNYNKSDYNYLIISNTTLLDAAEDFRKYRTELTPGEKYKAPTIFNITDVYNQFNYGEPSPVAIRRFVDYMVSDGNLNKYLLLLGKSVSRNDKMVKEMPDEVPTVGFPGSDFLLVDGLGGQPQDVEAIPVGRVPAISNVQARAYLKKVEVYENSSTGLDWRKKVLHISGGKSLSEVGIHSSNLASAGNAVTGAFGGTIDVRNKTQNGDVIQPLDISAAINSGVGMITYFGHSAPYQTDYNFGYVSDNAKGYTDQNVDAGVGKFAIMYYNGCDILNVFNNQFNETVNISSSRAQSLDWLLNPKRGAVAVFGNTWAGYNQSCNEYLQELYPIIFGQSDKNRLTIGQILRKTAIETKNNPNPFRLGADENARIAAASYSKRQAQMHQTLLLGDPALRVLISTEGSMPVDLSYFEAKLVSANSVEVAWKTNSETNNSHFLVERSYNAKNFEQIGYVEGNGDMVTESTYKFFDNKPLPGTSYYRLVQVDNDKVTDGKTEEGKKTLSSIVSVNRPYTNSLVVSPNPSSDFVEIKLDLPVAIKSWNLVDIKGRVVRRNETKLTLDISNLASGGYIVEILTENGDVISRKLVKQ